MLRSLLTFKTHVCGFFICEVFTLKLGAIYCRCMKMKTGDITLKTAVIYDVMNKTCCVVDCNDPRDRAFAILKRKEANSLGLARGRGEGHGWN